MELRCWLQKIRKSDLGSVTIMGFLLPSTNNFARSRLPDIAKLSPSAGKQLFSTLLVKHKPV